MAINRRQFLKRTGLAAAGAFFGQSFFHTPLLRRAFATTLEALDRYLVVIFLDGGNDGLNTVTPIANGTSGTLRTAYTNARNTSNGGLQLPAAALAVTAIGNDFNTQTPLALHPGLIGLKGLWDRNALAVIQGCGDPISLNFLSHEFSRNVWETGNPSGDGAFPGGWFGRYLAANYSGGDIPSVNIRDSVAGEFAQTATSVLAITQLENFGFPYDNDYFDDQLMKRDAFANLCAEASAALQPTVRYLGDTGTATLNASESYPPLSAMYDADRQSFSQAYDNLGTSFAQDMREVAKVIYGVKSGIPNIKARSFELANGGYDTHSDQGAEETNGQHYDLLSTVGNAVEALYNDCEDMGVANKLCVVIWSEFSRRIEQNANGTDHGTQGPVFVIGGPSTSGGHLVRGLYGNHPNINDVALAEDGNTVYSQMPGDPYRSTDFRDVYGTIMKHWLGVASPTLFLPVDSGDPNLYWTAPNFDLGFLT